MTNEITFTIADGKIFSKKLNAIARHIKGDVAYYALNGVHLSGTADSWSIQIEATDGYTLARETVVLAESLSHDLDVTIDGKMLATAVKTLVKGRQWANEIKVTAATGFSMVHETNGTVTLPIMDNTFPDTSPFVPLKNGLIEWSTSEAIDLGQPLVVGISPENLMRLAQSVKDIAKTHDASVVKLTIDGSHKPITATLNGDNDFHVITMPMFIKG